MSRIGNKPVAVPDGTTVTLEGNSVTAKGRHGSMSVEFNDRVRVVVEDGTINVRNATGADENKKFQGLYRSLINNLMIGVSQGFTRKLELVGVGYRAAVQGGDLLLDVGYSIQVKLPIPEGVTATVENNINITLWGIDKQKVGQFAANIRENRPPEPYKGKGIKYAGEIIRRKSGKAGAIGKGE